MKLRCQFFTRSGRQSQSSKRQITWFGCQFHSPLPTELPSIANNDKHIDEYNDEYLSRGFVSASLVSLDVTFQIPKLSSLVYPLVASCLK